MKKYIIIAAICFIGGVGIVWEVTRQSVHMQRKSMQMEFEQLQKELRKLQVALREIPDDADLWRKAQKILNKHDTKKLISKWKAKVKYLYRPPSHPSFVTKHTVMHRPRAEIKNPFVGAVVKLDLARGEGVKVLDVLNLQEYLIQYGSRNYWLKLPEFKLPEFNRKEYKSEDIKWSKMFCDNADIDTGCSRVYSRYFGGASLMINQYGTPKPARNLRYMSEDVHKITGTQEYIDKDGKQRSVFVIEPYDPSVGGIR